MSTHLRLRLPTLSLASLSLLLNLAILACAARTLHLFTTQQRTNPWLLPIWPNHFDLRGLQTLIGTSASILVLNGVAVVALVVPSLPATLTTTVTSTLSTLLSLLAIILPSILNNQAPRRDTLQTWTCAWSRTTIYSGQQPPAQFDTICHETRFAFFATIPVLVLQLCLLATAGLAWRTSRRVGDVELKGGQQYEMDRKTPSFEVKAEVEGSPKSTVTESARILPEGKGGV